MVSDHQVLPALRTSWYGRVPRVRLPELPPQPGAGHGRRGECRGSGGGCYQVLLFYFLKLLFFN